MRGTIGCSEYHFRSNDLIINWLLICNRACAITKSIDHLYPHHQQLNLSYPVADPEIWKVHKEGCTSKIIVYYTPGYFRTCMCQSN